MKTYVVIWFVQSSIHIKCYPVIKCLEKNDLEAYFKNHVRGLYFACFPLVVP